MQGFIIIKVNEVEENGPWSIFTRGEGERREGRGREGSPEEGTGPDLDPPGDPPEKKIHGERSYSATRDLRR